jgi:hypothetical protein
MEWRRWIDAFRAKSRALLRRRQDNEDIQDELQFHIAMQTRLNAQKGMSDDEASRRARVALGGVTQTNESARDVRPLRWLDGLVRDVRYTVRSLRRAPGFAIVAVLGVLALLASVVQIFIWTVKTAPLDPRLSLRFAATTLLALLASFHLYMYDLAIAFLPLLFCLEYTFCRRDLRVRILQLFVGSSLLVWIYPSIRLSSVEFKTTVIWMSSLLIAILIDLSAKANSTLHSVHANPEGPIGRTFAD